MTFAERWATLTQRQKQVCLARCRCSTRARAANDLGIEQHTMSNHLKEIKEKLAYESTASMCFDLGVLVGRKVKAGE